MMTKDDLNKLFDKLIEKIKSVSNIKLSSNFSDGRINSILNEKYFIKKIFEVFQDEVDDIIKPNNNRNWYDLAFIKNGTFIPFNIKMTSKFGNDNVSSKSALFWTFFDLNNDEVKNNFSWSDFKKIFKNKNVPSEYRDYYFFILNKNDTNDIFYTSFKQLKSISKNRNNLPFQANWDKNRELINRDEKNAFLFCFKTFYDSLQDLKITTQTLDDIDKIVEKNYKFF